MTRVTGYWSLVTAIALAAAAIAQRALTGHFHPEELLWGWGLALVQGLLAVWIDRRGMRGNPDYFMAWALGAQAFRLLGVVAILWLAYKGGMANFTPFATAAMAGILVMMAAQVWALHKGSISGTT
jgi:hypothetical protein